jgi:N-acetylneuraminate synthase
MSIFIIAEIGINHNGSLDIAKQLIDMAKECGCDAVKFQKREIDIVYDEKMLDSYRESPWGSTQRAQKEGLEFGKDEYDEIDQYCSKKDIFWFASAWDLESQKFLRQYDCKYNKVASAMLTHLPLIEAIVEEGKHTFISSGMSCYEQIDKALSIFKEKACPFTLMHCISIYPCPDAECNVAIIPALKAKYNCPIGYSGHEVGILPSVVAVAMGAEVIERHITLDRAMYGSDQAASLEQRGLELLVRDCRAVKPILGNSVKKVSKKELSIADKLRYFCENNNII